MKRNFSLIELIVSIVVMGILLSIVIINILDSKKEAIKVSVLSNTKLIQNAVDSHFLKEMEDYPTIGNLKPTLNNPQLIDVETLVKEGLLKKDLDLSKIKTQYYWLDVFGKVWGATNKDIHSINLYSLDAENSLEFVLGKKVKGYKLYETLGYGETSLENLTASSVKDIEKLYKEVGEVEISNHSNGNLIKIDLPNKESNYLVSILDEYGLETAPFGKFSSNFSNGFKPLLNKTGVYEFEINSGDLMHWISYMYVVETPGESSVTFDFKITNEEGVFEDWNEDFYSLEPSKNIIARVDMKGDDKGNKPSLFDFKIEFEFESQLEPNSLPAQKVDIPPVDKVCPKSTFHSDFSRLSAFKGSGLMVYSFYIKEGSFFETDLAPKIDFATNLSYKINKVDYFISLDGNSYVSYSKENASGKCMLVVYDITVLEVPPKEAIEKNCKITKSCYIDYCKELGTCPIPISCEDTNSCISNPTCLDLDCPQSKNCIELNNCPKPKENLCGSGATISSPISGNYVRIVYNYLLNEDDRLSRLEIRNSFEGYVLENIYIEYSENKEPFKKANSFSDIPKGSCFNVVYELTKIAGYCASCSYVKPIPNPPIIKLCTDDCPAICVEDCVPQFTGGGKTPIKVPDWCDYNDCSQKPTCINYGSECIPPVCSDDCKTTPPIKPSPKDKVLLDEEWTTVDTIRFFAHGSLGQMTRWYKAEHIDSINTSYSSNEISEAGNVRIVYRYAKSLKLFWSEEYVDFSKTGVAQSVLGIAYVQVKTDKIEDTSVEDYPTVQKIRFHNEQGYLDVSMVQPTLTIIPIKDNNIGREVFSDESNIQWTYSAADPRNKEIVDIEWAGDIRDKYPVGVYNVQARVKNSVEIWSEWITYELEILQEKPIALLNYDRKESGDSYIFDWNLNKSLDYDGDYIVDYQFENAKETYPIGQHLVRARVKDSEGYWSDWAETKIVVNELGRKIYRLETEWKDPRISTYGTVLNVPNFSNESGVEVDGAGNGLVQFTFEGNGFDYYSDKISRYVLNEKTVVNADSGLISVRDLEYGTHVVTIYKQSSLFRPIIDYLDVYSPYDKPTVTPIKTLISTKGVEAPFENDTFSTKLEQSIRQYYRVDKDSTVKVSILDKDGKTIRNLESKFVRGGNYPMTSSSWDGKGNNGSFVSNGNYTFNIEATGVNGSKSIFQKEINLLNISPVYRLEAEAIDSRIVSLGTITTMSEFSNKGGFEVGSAGNGRIQFTFEGTGFDYYADNISSFTLNNNARTNAPTGLVSVRNLEHGKHTVVIYKSNGSIIRPVVDYLDVYSLYDKPTITPVKTLISTKGVEAPFENDTFSTKLEQSIRQYYRVDNDSTVKVSILDKDGKIIRNLETKFVRGGTYPMTSSSWEGKDNNGVFVSNGHYTFNIEATGVNGSKSIFQKNITLLNVTPIYRLEAEAIDSRIVSLGTITPMSEFSNKGGFEVGSAGNGRIQFTFEGTGFDYYADDISSFILNNNARTNAPTGLVSVRNLEYGNHTVVIYKSNGSIIRPIVDYLDVYSSNDKPIITPIRTSISTNGVEATFENDTFSTNLKQSLVHYYRVDKDSNITVSVFDDKNQLVRKLENRFVRGGTYPMTSTSWDGKNNNGNFVSNGVYKLEIEAVGVNGSKTISNKNVTLLNSLPNYRIEAESIDSRIVKSGTLFDVPDFSNQKGFEVGGAGNGRIQFTFEGTGFDYYSNNESSFKLDSNNQVNAPSGLVSVRNLEYGTHVLIIYKKMGSVVRPVVDYLDVY